MGVWVFGALAAFIDALLLISYMLHRFDGTFESHCTLYTDSEGSVCFHFKVQLQGLFGVCIRQKNSSACRLRWCVPLMSESISDVISSLSVLHF